MQMCLIAEDRYSQSPTVYTKPLYLFIIRQTYRTGNIFLLFLYIDVTAKIASPPEKTLTPWKTMDLREFCVAVKVLAHNVTPFTATT